MKKLSLMMLTILSGLLIISSAYAANVNCTADGTCENATFSTVAPDALIVLDLSANMNLNPAGGTKNMGKRHMRVWPIQQIAQELIVRTDFAQIIRMRITLVVRLIAPVWPSPKELFLIC